MILFLFWTHLFYSVTFFFSTQGYNILKIKQNNAGNDSIYTAEVVHELIRSVKTSSNQKQAEDLEDLRALLTTANQKIEALEGGANVQPRQPQELLNPAAGLRS